MCRAGKDFQTLGFGYSEPISAGDPGPAIDFSKLHNVAARMSQSANICCVQGREARKRKWPPRKTGTRTDRHKPWQSIERCDELVWNSCSAGAIAACV